MQQKCYGMSYENKKNAHLWRHQGAFFIRLNDKNSADKVQSKGQGDKSALPSAN